MSTHDDGRVIAAEEVETLDRKVAGAVRDAAAAIVHAGSFKEDLLHDALEPALERRFGPDRVCRRRSRARAVLPDWMPQPQSIDVSVLTGETLRLAFELKVDDIRFTLWDMLKMAAATRIASVQRAYLVVAARTWDSPRARQAGRRFFSVSPSPRAVSVVELFDEYRRTWAHDLTASRARPTRFPEALELAHVAAASVPAWPRYELRALAVCDAPGTGYRSIDAQGWPVGITPWMEGSCTE